MAKKMLIVIDMLNDFLHPNGSLNCGEDSYKIIPFVKNVANQFIEEEQPIIVIKDAHLRDDLEFENFPVHCVKGTWGAELLQEIKFLEEYPKVYLIEKQRYSSFYNTNLENIIQKEKPEEFYIVGVCTNICVLYTVEELCNRDYKTFIYLEGVASFDSEAHEFALQQMESVLGAKLI